jgi:hypothetical protein
VGVGGEWSQSGAGKLAAYCEDVFLGHERHRVMVKAVVGLRSMPTAQLWGTYVVWAEQKR